MRECRRVPKTWNHPVDKDGRYKPMSKYIRPYLEDLREWLEAATLWDVDIHPDQSNFPHCRSTPYWEWAGKPPDPEYRMPYWPEAERTHYQMYETISYGTPISPIFETPEELARCLAGFNDEVFDAGVNYEKWLEVARTPEEQTLARSLQEKLELSKITL